MMLFETAFAVVLLTVPTEATTVGGSLSHLAASRQSLQTLAVEWELLDPREVKFVLSSPETFEVDVGALQRRHESYGNAPPLADAWRFPGRTAIGEALEFNRAYRADWCRRQEADPPGWWHYQEVIGETDDLYQTWDLVRDAGCSHYYTTVRRRALSELRERLGNEAYYSGSMPPHVPLWRFVRIK